MKNTTFLNAFILFIFSLFSISLLSQNQSCLEFDGSNDYVKYNDDTTLGLLDGATNYTLEAWVYPIDGTVAEYDRVFQRYYSFAIVMYDGNNDGKIEDWYFQVKNGSNWAYYNTEGDQTLSLDEWNHIAVINNTIDGSLKLFVNGVDVSQSGGFSNIDLPPSQSNDKFYIGQKGNGASYFGGRIDEVRLKNIAEDPANIQNDVYDAPYDSDANTAALFHFDETSGSTTVNDASGTNAYLYNGVTWINGSFGLPMESEVPLEIIYFKAKLIDDNIELYWNCEYRPYINAFEIQKSVDGASWNKIAYINNEKQKKNYSFIDKTILNSINYYRLKLINFDGTISYSKVISIEIKYNEISIYPNPVEDNLIISGLKENEFIDYRIYNTFGQKIAKGVTNGKINLCKIIPGLYFLQTKNKILRFFVK